MGIPLFPGQPVPVPDHSFYAEIVLNVQPKSFLVQLETISMRLLHLSLEENKSVLS